MKKIAAALVVGCALVATAGAGATTGRTGAGHRAAAAPPIVWGAADDTAKFADDGGNWFYGQLTGAGLSSNRWTLAWDPSNPTVIKEQGFLDRAAPKAQAAGVRVLLALYAGTPAPAATQHDAEGFCTWAGKVATLAKSWGIHDFIVWNEPNTRLYWSPQKDSAGNDVAGPAYESLLARCYDTIHANDEQANVIGMGLSPRASTGESNEPLVFLRDVGKAYKASGRTKPIMDQLSVHPYPNPNSPTDSPDVGYEVKDRFGISNMDRVKQTVYDAFNGTGQPTTLNGLTLVIDEVGWQTDTTGMAGYVNDENVKTISESTQAAYLKLMAQKYFACDPAIVSVQLFLLIDEPYRNGRNEVGQSVGGGWQSGLLTTGGVGKSRPKAAYTQDASIFSAGRSACQGQMINWQPSGSTAGGGSGGPGSAVVAGDLSQFLSNPASFQDVFTRLALLNAQLKAMFDNFAKAMSSWQSNLNQLLNGFLPSQNVNLQADVVNTPGTLSPGSLSQRSTAAVAKAKTKRVATASFTARAGAKAKKVKLRSLLKKGAKAPAGRYYLKLTVKSATSASKQVTVAVPLRSVVATPVTKKAKH